MVNRRTVRIACVALALGLFATRADAHPLHTTLTQVSVAADGGIQIVIRAFVDDFSAAVTGRVSPVGSAIPTPAEPAAARYLGDRLLLSDRSGRRIALAVTNIRRTDDLVWVTLRTASASASGVRLTNRVLFERWDDQVNIVQSSLGGRQQTLLFTRSEANVAKAL